MKNQPGEAKSREHKRVAAAAADALLFACLVAFVLGCNETPVPTMTDYGTGNMDPIGAEAFGIIRDGLADASPLIRVKAIEVVATTGQIKLMRTVQRLLEDESMPVRFAAAVAIGDLQYSIARTSMSRALGDRDANVVIAASYAMGRLGDTEYFEVIRKMLNSDDQTVRANAALLLGKTGDPSAINLLKRAQQSNDSSDKVRFQVLEARAQLGDEQVLRKLWAIVYSGYSDDKIMGVRAMGALGNRDARDILVTKLDDDILEVRLAVAEQLGKLGDVSGEPEVLDVFEKKLTAGLDERALARTNVLTALAIGQICTPGLTKHLPKLMKNESKSVRLAAAKAVFLCGTR
ncbi:MAG: HEAT repeat domain-containing protein [Planctomycetes bacterium]|nr:HEAT repeat domain-containing protein [Planctomycetota bacterium]MBL7185187.1 HEAT repeat domain-containing protein [Phycisphaerae bacterium]